LPEGGYGERGWNIKRVLDGNPKRAVIVIGHLDDWDESWQDGYRLVDYGLVHWLVRAGDLPTFEAWLERDRRAMATYDVVPALRAQAESWEHALGQRVLGMQVGRAHQSLVYGNENGDPAPAGVALGLLEDVVVKSGGDEKLGIEGWPGVPKLDMGPALWKDLGIVYEIFARTDKKYFPRIAVAYEGFIERAEPGDPDVPAARNYLQQIRLFQGRLHR
jgi:hypothetical protein